MTVGLKPFREIPKDLREWTRWMRQQDIPEAPELTGPKGDPGETFRVHGVGDVITDIVTDPANADCRFKVSDDGDCYAFTSTVGVYVRLGSWLQTGLTADYAVRVSEDPNSVDTPTTGNMDGWQTMFADRIWTLTEGTASNTKLTRATVSWRDKVTLEIVGWASIKMTSGICSHIPLRCPSWSIF